MLLTISTTHRPATDLGYLLVKHPGRLQRFETSAGPAYVGYPEAGEERCTAALVLDVDPIALTRGRHTVDDFTLGRYVNERPYAASSLLSVALGKVFRSALAGRSKDRPELAGTAIPLEVAVPVTRGTAELCERLFGPLGWTVEARRIPLDPDRPEWGDSPYVSLRLSGELTVSAALNHLYVLLPVLDDAKHYWISGEEVDKLVRAGEGWLPAHPARDLITRRYLKRKATLVHEARARLAEDIESLVDEAVTAVDEEAELPVEEARKVPLAALRREAIVGVLKEKGAAEVADLGCGGGALLVDLFAEHGFRRILGADVSTRALEIAERRLRLDRRGDLERQRISLVQTALTYADDRLKGFDAAVLMEVVEHIDPPRLPAMAYAVFGHAAPSTVVMTTPNAEYNVRFEGMAEGAMRHHDHRFEWNRAEFAAWCGEQARRYGYDVEITGVGDDDSEVGAPTQMAVFSKGGTA
ncbi:3' terminal RNA ribose 2'-O-methyltransferase Hen1 [Phytomonospora sp. NPDC050363]|uniref:3' terminal RNA ribose 2'-O-methyltransferase Hen1 n=1 Tax=Phytomonospora sp. NPDC050363 TaxID=3155642 RepID=UPI0033CBC6F2